jgi:hypothetical protein
MWSTLTNNSATALVAPQVLCCGQLVELHPTIAMPVQVALAAHRSCGRAVLCFRQMFTLEDAIVSHAFSPFSSGWQSSWLVLEDAIVSRASSLEANMRLTNGIPLGCPLLLPVGTVI